MSAGYSRAEETARSYYNSDDADEFYFNVWGGEDIHIGLYESPAEAIATASRRTVERMAAKLTAIDSNSQIIDVGAGYGGSARYLAASLGCQVTALNLSEKENERDRQMVEAAGLQGRVAVLDGSFEHIPCSDQTFDACWSQDAILHSGNRSQVLAEVHRVLKPGGQFVFTDPMQTDDCPPDVLQPVLERIHLPSLGSPDFYRSTATALGFVEESWEDLSAHLITHYQRVHDELASRRSELVNRISAEYIDRMLQGLTNWVNAGQAGHLVWGIFSFRKA